MVLGTRNASVSDRIFLVGVIAQSQSEDCVETVEHEHHIRGAGCHFQGTKVCLRLIVIGRIVVHAYILL